MLTRLRSAVFSFSQRGRVAGRHRTAKSRTLRVESLESRRVLSGDSWVVPMGVSGYAASGVSADEYGNVYAAGNEWHGTPTGFYETVWLRKYSADAQAIWGIDLQESDNQVFYGVAATPDAVYVAGCFTGTAQLDPAGGPQGVLKSVGDYDGYLAKYSGDGQFQWARQWGGTGSDRMFDLEVVGGHVYVAGALGRKGGHADTVVVKVNGDGVVQWTNTISGATWGTFDAVRDSESGLTSVFVSGSVNDRGFVTKFRESPDGQGANVEWTTSLGSRILPFALAVGADGVNDGASVYLVHNTSAADLVLSKFDSAGRPIWSQPFLGVDVPDLDVESGVVYLAGMFEGQVDLDADGPSLPMTSWGSDDGFLARYDAADGGLLSAQRMGGTSSDKWGGGKEALHVLNNRLYMVSTWSSLEGAYPTGLPGQMSAFVAASVSGNTLLMNLDVAAPAVVITSPVSHTAVNDGTLVTLTASASSGTITWYESNVAFDTGESVTVALSGGTHRITAIATDGAGPIGMEGVVIDVGLPVAANDATTTLQDTPVMIDVLANDSDPDGDTLSVINASVPRTGSVIINSDDTITYTPNAGFLGTDTFRYTISDGNGGTDTAWVSVKVTEPVTGTPIYVYDIRFESRRGKEWRAIFEIRNDSNADGQGSAADAVAAGVTITVNFAGCTYTGVTGSDGVFRTSWINKLASGDHYANVADLVLAGYYWNRLSMDLEDDTDGDGNPDDVFHR